MELIRKIKIFFSEFTFSKLAVLAVMCFIIYLGIIIVYNTVNYEKVEKERLLDEKKEELEVIETLDITNIEDEEVKEVALNYEEELNKRDEVNKLEKNEQILETFYYCLATSNVTENYDCLENLVVEDARSEIISTSSVDSSEEAPPQTEGQAIYQFLVGENMLSTMNKVVVQERYEHSIYELEYLYFDGKKRFFDVEIKEGKITKFKEKVGNQDEENI